MVEYIYYLISGYQFNVPEDYQIYLCREDPVKDAGSYFHTILSTSEMRWVTTSLMGTHKKVYLNELEANRKFNEIIKAQVCHHRERIEFLNSITLEDIK